MCCEGGRFIILNIFNLLDRDLKKEDVYVYGSVVKHLPVLGW
jgi:hypothetical protein